MSEATCEVLTSLEALERERPEWTALADRAPDATPFQRPEWLIPWCLFFGPAGLEVLAVRSAGRLVALFPLARGEDGGIGLLGAGITDYLDPLVDPDFAASALMALYGHLARTETREADFEQLRASSPLVRAPPPPGWTYEDAPHDPCPVLALGPDAVPVHQRARFRKYDRRAGREVGEPRLERATRETWRDALETFFHLHRERWRTRGLPGVLAENTLRRFHAEVARAFTARDALRLYVLRMGGTPAACLYGFTERRRLYCYLQGFDPAFERFSPGMLVVGHVIASAEGEGMEAVDFLRGREAYKFAWGAREVGTVRRRISRDSFGR